VPVVFLNDLLELQQVASAHPQAASTDAHQQLLVLQAPSPWALLIAEAVALESLETLLTPEGSWEEMNQSPVMGTAMYRNQIVQVLDPNRLAQFAQQVFDDLWCAHAPARPSSQQAAEVAR
jgi:hypothetical protein